MSNDSNLPVIPVHVTVVENGGGYSAVYTPDPAAVSGVPVRLQYLLDTEGWAFDKIDFGAPFSDLETISPTEFQITDNGTEQGSYSFSVKIISTAAHRGAQETIDTDPEVTNGPPA
ncbi:MAG TPA: hypothetical protein VFU95_03765 [Telluria sp.]|nr:hypothetical protein [Telluria sp.]